jgi:hypothetical protein
MPVVNTSTSNAGGVTALTAVWQGHTVARIDGAGWSGVM